MRADRLITLLLLLQKHARLTVADIAERLEVSARTVLRDVDALSGLGVPVYADRGRNGGIRLIAGYETDLGVLSSGEAEALALVSTPSVVSGLGLEKPLASALEKIAAAVPTVHQLRAQHARHRLLFDTSPWFHSKHAPPVLETLREAVWADRICRIQYRRADGIAKGYRAKPYAIVAKVDVWYLVADTAQGMRVFRLTRIQATEPTDETFVRDAAFDLHRFWEAWCKRFEADPGNHFDIELSLTRRGKAYLLEHYRNWHGHALETFDDALPRARVTLDMEREETAMRLLFELGAEATVIRPQSFRNKLAALARRVLRAATANA
jgi:predicted DNA-binding transcriptional regulator YafY